MIPLDEIYAVTPNVGGRGQTLHIWLPDFPRRAQSSWSSYGYGPLPRPEVQTLCGQDASTHWGGMEPERRPKDRLRRRRSHVPLPDALAWASIKPETYAFPLPPDPRPTWRWCPMCTGRLLDHLGLTAVALQTLIPTTPQEAL